jgi:hypothetical protein
MKDANNDNNLNQPLLLSENSNNNSLVEQGLRQVQQRKQSVPNKVYQFYRRIIRNIKLSVSNASVTQSKDLLFHTQEETTFSTNSNTNYDGLLLLKNTMLLCFAMLGIVFMIVTNCLNYNYAEHKDVVWMDYWNEMHLKDIKTRDAPLYGQYITYMVFKWLNVPITCICIVLLIDYYVCFSRLKRDQWNFSSSLAAFFFSSLCIKFLGELIVILITPVTPIPGFDEYTSLPFRLDDKIGVLMFFRLYIAMRAIRDYSVVYKKRQHIVHAMLNRQQAFRDIYRKCSNDPKKRVTLTPPPIFGWRLTFRMLYYERTVQTLAVAITIVLITFGFTVWVVERDKNPLVREWQDVVWIGWVTIMTMGFGDVTPVTTFGRAACVLEGVIGNILVVFMIGVVINNLKPSGQQKKSILYMKSEFLKKKRGIQAVRILQVCWLYKRNKCTLSHKYFTMKYAMLRIQKLNLKLQDQGDESINMIAELNRENQKLEQSLNIVLNKLHGTLEILYAKIQSEREQGITDSSVSIDLSQLTNRIVQVTQGSLYIQQK